MGLYISGMDMPVGTILTVDIFPDGTVADHWFCKIYGKENVPGGLAVPIEGVRAAQLPPHDDLISKQTALALLHSDYAYAAMDIIEKEVPVIIPAERKEHTWKENGRMPLANPAATASLSARGIISAMSATILWNRPCSLLKIIIRPKTILPVAGSGTNDTGSQENLLWRFRLQKSRVHLSSVAYRAGGYTARLPRLEGYRSVPLGREQQ